MKKYYKIILLLVFIYSAIFAQNDFINLVAENKSDYTIIISDSASSYDSLAAEELQFYLKKISGVVTPIFGDSVSASDKEMVIGLNNRSSGIDVSSIKYDGFIIRTEKKKIYFLGSKEKGTLNAVYTFLDKYLDCRFYSAKVNSIPSQANIRLAPINISENPVFSYRSTHSFEGTNDEYCRWHKLVDSKDKKIWGMFVHTFHTLIPEEKYFKTHPEYFALRDSLRVPLQLCLTNPDVFNIVIAELKKRMEQNPDAKIWSVSQNDNEFYCQCESCRQIDEHEESPSGSLLAFVNKVSAEFPDKTISTLAYQYSRKPPKYIKPNKNVNIMLCSIEELRTNPLETNTSNRSFANNLKVWSKLTNNLFIWDYVVQFTNLVSPFPNFHVLQPNIQFFAKYGAPMIFEQGAGHRQGAEFSELRSYLIVKLLWNPNINIDSVMNDFLSGYYGPASRHIRFYIDLMTDKLHQSKARLWIYDNPVNSKNDYLSPDLVKRYNKIFDSAEAAVADQQYSEFLERVKAARLPLQYAMLEQAKVIGEGEQGIYIKDRDVFFKTNPKIEHLLDEFLTGCKKIGNVQINEKQLSAETYVSRYKTMLSKTMKNPLGLFKPVTFVIQPNWKYPANGEKTLTDGHRGDEDHHFNWIGFEGENMDVIVDLKETTIVRKVSADFLQISFSWIFLPQEVEISLSMDGKNFNTVSTLQNSTGVTKEETKSPTNAIIQNFSAEFSSRQARYVQVKAANIKTCPRWHPGYPGMAWIFTDEIVIE